MAAGESAYDVARRQREQAERLQRSAEKWEKGADGEAAVARALEALPEGWVSLHDLAWPGRQRANIDHVVIGPGGVFVVDAKNWSGRIEVRDQVLAQNGRGRESAVSSVTAATIAVQDIVAPARCTGVLCFVRDEPVNAASWQVTVCSTANLVGVSSSRPAVLGPDDVRRCVDAVVRGTTRSATGPSAGRRPDSRPAKRRKGHPVLALVGMVALLAAIASGGLQRAADWTGQQLVSVVQTDPPADPAKKPADQQTTRKKDRKQRPSRG